MEKVVLCCSLSEFEGYLNDGSIEILKTDIKVVEQSCNFQDSFAGVVHFRERGKDCKFNKKELEALESLVSQEINECNRKNDDEYDEDNCDSWHFHEEILEKLKTL